MRLGRRRTTSAEQADGAVPEPLGTGERALDSARLQLGWVQSREVRSADRLQDAEFRVFSQFGEDGIIQFLTQRVPIECDIFVEFGVQDYRESNTRFLLEKDNWRGLIIDAGDAHQAFLESSELGWRHWIDAVTAFIDRDNINELISAAGISGDIGLLSIDIDGNDYWVLEAIEAVSPRLLVVEYNSLFGPEAAITIPYDPRFDRTAAHASGLYFGASLAALTRLAGERGYALVGSNRAGGNAFFVRRDVIGQIPELPVAEGYVPSRFRQSRDQSGRLTRVSSHTDQLELIRDLPVVEVVNGTQLSVAEALGL